MWAGAWGHELRPTIPKDAARRRDHGAGTANRGHTLMLFKNLIYGAMLARPDQSSRRGAAQASHSLATRLPGRLLQRLVRPERDLALVAEAVDDRIAAVAAEILARRPSRPAPPGGACIRRDRAGARPSCTVSRSWPARHDVGDAHLALDQALQDVVEHVVGRQRILVLLVLAQLGRRRLGDDVLRDHHAVRPERAGGLPAVAQRARAGRPPSCRGP